MIFFLLLVNIILANLFSCSQATRNGGRQAQTISTAAKGTDANRPFWAARGRRSGWTVAAVDSEDKGMSEDDYGYLEPIDGEPYAHELWTPKLKRDILDSQVESKTLSSLDDTETGESHISSWSGSRPRRYNFGVNDSAPRRKSAMQEFFTQWLNQVKRGNGDSNAVTETSRPFWAARG